MTKEEFLKDDHFLSDYVLEGTDLNEVKEKEEELTDQQKDAWKQVYSFAHQVNQLGRKWSKTDVDHLAKQFYLSLDKVERAFKKVFEENKDQFGIADKPEIVKVEVWLKRKWDFVENSITQVPEFREKGKGDPWELLNVDSIFRQLQHAGFKFTIDKLKSLLRSDFVHRYDPFKDYFAALPTYNKQTDPDYIGALAKYVQVEDQDFFEAQFKKALVRCIGCSLYAVENRIVFVLVGEKQSTGKSTFLRFLNPFGNKYYTEAPLHHNKDSSFSLSENFIYNLEELASLSNVDVNRLKSIISTAVIKERKAYARDAVEQPRRANFFGSTNKTEFLTDTENTRWLCFNLKNIDWGYKDTVDIDLVWSQAYALYKDATFSDQLSQEEAQTRDAKNKDYEINDYEKELIKQYFQVCEAHEGEFYSNANILDALSLDGRKRLESRYIGKNMIQLGFLRGSQMVNGHTARGFYAKKIIGAYTIKNEKEEKPF
jgi:predicted P-loop ATPase